MDDVQKIRIPWPPSVNSYWRTFRGRTILSQKGRVYKKTQPPAFLAYTHSDRLQVDLHLYPPSKARRDLDNHAKACLDLLQLWGVFPDDSQIDVLTLRRMEVSPPSGFCVVMLRRL